MEELAGKCGEGHDLDLRQVPTKDEDEKEILCWLVYGICPKCNLVIMQMIHQEKLPPTEGIDFIINNSKKCDKTKPYIG